MSSEVDTGGFLTSTGGITLTNATLSGTTTLTGFTRGSVLFAGASSAVSQDNAKFFFDDGVTAAGIYQLGVGTATPSGFLSGTTGIIAYDPAGFTRIASNATGNSGGYGVVQIAADTPNLLITSHGSTSGQTQYGTSLNGWADISLKASGGTPPNGLALGTLVNAPLILGTNNLNQLQISGNGFVTVTNSFSVGGVLCLTPATWVDNQTTAAGQISVDANYIYVATATNTVKRVALTSF